MKTAADTFDLLRSAVLGEVSLPAAEATVRRRGWHRVVHAACWHGVENHLFRSLAALDSERFDLAPLEALYRRSIAVHLRAVSDLARVARLLGAAGIPALVVKGPVLAELYDHPDLRAYSDLDLVVPRDRFGAAVMALESGGGRLLDRGWKRNRAESRAQVHLEAAHGTAIDLHWHLLNRAIVRDGLAIDMDALFQRSRPARVSGVECLTTGSVDTALHVATHAGVSGGARLSHIADVRAVLAAGDLDWDEFVHRARIWGAGEMVAIMVARAVRVLEMQPPPAALVRGLAARGGWSAMVAGIEQRARPELGSDNGPVARLTRAARPGRTRSARAVASWFTFQVNGWMSRRLPRLGAGGDDPDTHRREYFASVQDPAGRSPD